MRPALDGLVVLVVEDDHDSMELVRTVLRHCGALVFAASDAAAALGILDAVQPTVLVSDIMMPGADGWWLVAEARRRGRLHDVPKVAMTSLDVHPEEVRSRGFDAYLRKPVDLDVLCATINALARGQSAA